MSVSIRLASLAEEQETLIEILDRNLPGRPNRQIQQMRYTNPLGPGWSWVANPAGSSAIVAMASVFPRSFWVNGKKVVSGQVVEFAVDSSYRSLGPAVLLQRATFEPVNLGQVAFGYDCPPDDRGMSTFARLGMQSSCDVVRYALLLRSNEYLGKRLGRGAWAQPLVAAANLALRVRRSSASFSRSLEVCLYKEPFNDEFSHLDQLVSSRDRVRAGRAAGDLNWKYFGDPSPYPLLASVNTSEYRILVARRDGELVAFAVLRIQADGIAWITDLFGHAIHETGGALLEAAIDQCRRENVSRLDALCSVGCDLELLLKGAGFRSRECVYRVVPYELLTQNSRLLISDLRWACSSFEVM
jgi:hypothetical protein